MAYTRRNFIKAAAATAAGVFSAPYVVTKSRAEGDGSGKPMKIIHFVSDGTSPSMVATADLFSRLTRGRRLCWLEMSKAPGANTGMMDMASLSSSVTDSSAASSSWGSGSRIANGAVNCLPDGTLLKPIYEVLGELNWKRGLVTTTEITHATPAGFGSASKSRGDTKEIARYYKKLNIDVLLGGGQNIYDDKLRKEYTDTGYSIIQTAEEMKNASNDKKLLGIFSGGHLPMTIDWLNDQKLQKTVPTLAQMADKALKMLGESDHFILQVEGGRVDHACHSSDAPGAVYDHLAMDDAVQVALDYQKSHPETLIVVTADHGTGVISLNGAGGGYNDTSKQVIRMRNAKGSFERLVSSIRKCKNAVELQNYIKELYSVNIGADKANLLLLASEHLNSVAYDEGKGFSCQLGQVLANHFAINWSGGNHTGDYVALVAKGPGSERFAGLIRNTDVFRNYVDFAGSDFRNKEWEGDLIKLSYDLGQEHWLDTPIA